ncbi:MAG: GIY-YIG nuclease family protein [Ignavibacteriae bacterium]|nr:GIY-YIG nuclease family protein [Ignavibacteriota bacterium]
MFVYIVECPDKTLYTGVTNDIERRIAEHNIGYNPNSYIFSRRPVILKFFQEFDDALQAIQVEKQLKGWSRAKEVALIEGKFDVLKSLAVTYELKK